MLNSSDQLKNDVISKVSLGKIRISDACKLLSKSEKTIRRYLASFLRSGIKFVKHGNTGKEPVNKISEEIKQKAKKLVIEKYHDFNMLHCMEQLEKNHAIVFKRETFRKLCHEIKMVKRSKRRRSIARKRREPMSQVGLMLQFDGSPERWFGGVESCLITGVDDASSEIPYGEFFNSENTIACMKVLRKIIEKNGLFNVLYTDKAGIFGGTKRMQFSQVKRALGELGINVLFANSPEAKGRIERTFQTLQDRLIPEMRLRNIRSFEAANSFLNEQYLPNEYNARFKKIPSNMEFAFRPLPIGINLDEIFCLKEHRIVKRDHTVSFRGEIFQLESPIKYSIYKQKIEIRIYPDETWKAFYAGKEIELTPVAARERFAA